MHISEIVSNVQDDASHKSVKINWTEHYWNRKKDVIAPSLRKYLLSLVFLLHWGFICFVVWDSASPTCQTLIFSVISKRPTSIKPYWITKKKRKEREKIWPLPHTKGKSQVVQLLDFRSSLFMHGMLVDSDGEKKKGSIHRTSLILVKL